MNYTKMPFPELYDSYLSKEILTENKIGTNLADLRGKVMMSLSRTMMSKSSIDKNISILRRIMHRFPNIFEKDEELSISSVFSRLGIHNTKYNLKWLIKLLYKFGELSPLKCILIKAPPYIIKIRPERFGIIKPGETISFEVRTVYPAEVIWMIKSRQDQKPLSNSLLINECSIERIEYDTRKSGNGTVYVEASSKGSITIKSEEVHVVDSDSPSYADVYKEIERTKNGMIVRVALLIGMMKYDSMKNLEAPKPDIWRLEQVLRSIGFKVFCFSDVNLEQLIHIIDVFANEFAKSGSYAFFYYAGHGSVKNQRDSIQLNGYSEIEVSEILRHISVQKPNPLLAIFDMCRTTKDTGNDEIKEMNLPCSKELILIMSTFPYESSYEKLNGCEFSSLIMEALCKFLNNFACSMEINVAVAKFSNDDSIKTQKPIIQYGPNKAVFGDRSIPAYKYSVSCEWVAKSLPIDVHFDVFHNTILVLIEEKNAYYVKPNTNRKSFQINLLENLQLIADDNSVLSSVYCHENKDGQNVWVSYPFKIFLPSDIVKFFKKLTLKL